MTATVAPSATRLRWGVLGLALFVYLTVELFPIGALTEIATGLDVTPARVGLLLTAYAALAGLATLPALALTRRLDRRTVLVGSLVLLTVAQVGFALAPTFAVAVAARAVAALAHGLLWSQVPVVAVRYAPTGRAAQATAAVFVGSSLALVAGAPLSAALASSIGWRPASVVLAAAAALTALGLRAALPATPALPRPDRAGSLPWRPVLVVCAATVVLVIGHYLSYTYLELLLTTSGVPAGAVAPALALYGAAGLVGVLAVGRHLDQRPRTTSIVVCAALTVGVGGLAVAGTPIAALVLVAVWGATAAALPVVLQTAALRAAPENPDTASGAYVVAYQVGITAGSATGATALTLIDVNGLPAVSGLVLAAGTMLVAGARKTFG